MGELSTFSLTFIALIMLLVIESFGMTPRTFFVGFFDMFVTVEITGFFPGHGTLLYPPFEGRVYSLFYH